MRWLDSDQVSHMDNRKTVEIGETSSESQLLRGSFSVYAASRNKRNSWCLWEPREKKKREEKKQEEAENSATVQGGENGKEKVSRIKNNKKDKEFFFFFF